MKNRLFSVLAGVLALAAVIVPIGAGFAYAQSTASSASDLLGAVNSLQTVDAARQNITTQVNLQLAQLTEEVQNLPSQPRNTVDEQQALAAELGAISAKLNELSTVSSTLDQVQSTENSIFATLQANMRALGI